MKYRIERVDDYIPGGYGYAIVQEDGMEVERYATELEAKIEIAMLRHPHSQARREKGMDNG